MARTEAAMDSLRAIIRCNITVTIDIGFFGKNNDSADLEVRHEHQRKERADQIEEIEVYNQTANACIILEWQRHT